jgi:hypothetical protein
MSATGDWEPPVAAAPVVVDAAEVDAPAAALEAASPLAGAADVHFEPPSPALPIVDDVLLELATADTRALEPMVDLEIGAPEAGPPIEPLVLLELGEASEPAAMATTGAPFPAAELPELELLELPTPPAEARAATPAPEPVAIAPPEPAAEATVPHDEEPFHSDVGAAYDVTREAESPRSGRGARGKHRKGKAAAPKQSPVAALERLLRRVETRRAEITSESVA